MFNITSSENVTVANICYLLIAVFSICGDMLQSNYSSITENSY